MKIILIILALVNLILLCYQLFTDRSYKKIKISPQNKILFYKLQKQYLNNCSNNDIEQLIYFLEKYLEVKNENKKK